MLQMKEKDKVPGGRTKQSESKQPNIKKSRQ